MGARHVAMEFSHTGGNKVAYEITRMQQRGRWVCAHLDDSVRMILGLYLDFAAEDRRMFSRDSSSSDGKMSRWSRMNVRISRVISLTPTEVHRSCLISGYLSVCPRASRPSVRYNRTQDIYRGISDARHTNSPFGAPEMGEDA